MKRVLLVLAVLAPEAGCARAPERPPLWRPWKFPVPPAPPAEPYREVVIDEGDRGRYDDIDRLEIREARKMRRDAAERQALERPEIEAEGRRAFYERLDR